MRYALIGCGRIAPLHLSSAMGLGFDVLALCDPDTNAVDTLVAKTGFSNVTTKRFADYRLMLDECSPDMVAVATDSGSHAEICIECLERGIAVLVEKPMALSLADADRMIRIAESNHVPLGVCQQNRFNDASVLVRKALDSGAFGTLSHVSVQVRWWRDKGYYAQAPWRGTWAKDGGALMNQCIHGLDLMRWFGGSRIDRVSGVIANRSHPYLEVEDIGIAHVEFSNGALGSLEGTTNLYRKNLEERITVIGSTGTAILGGECAQHIDLWHFEDPAVQALADEIKTGTMDSVYGTSHPRVYTDFASAVKGNRQPTVDGRSGRDALEMVLAVYKSHLDKAPVTLPLLDFGTDRMRL